MDSKRDIVIKVRLTSDELDCLSEKSKNSGSRSAYIRQLILNSNDYTFTHKLKLMEVIKVGFNDSSRYLANISGNFNQVVKRANELNVIGLLSREFIYNDLLPQINEARKSLAMIREQLEKCVRQIV